MKCIDCGGKCMTNNSKATKSTHRSKEDLEKNFTRIDMQLTEARHEKTVKKIVIALVISIITTLVSNMAWLWYISQFDFGTTETTVTYTQDGKGTNIIGKGDIDFGSNAKNSNNNKKPD